MSARLLQIKNNTNPSSREDLQKAAIAQVEKIRSNGGIKYKNKEVAASLFGLEGLNDAVKLDELTHTMEELTNELGNPAMPFYKYLNDFVYSNSKNKAQDVAFGLEHAALTILGSADLKAHKEFTSVRLQPGMLGEAQVVMPLVDGPSYSIESFEETKSESYIAATAVINAQTAIPGGFEEVWFPTQLVPAGEAGVSVNVTIPHILTVQTRNANGQVTNWNKINMIQAVTNPDVLESNQTNIVPYSSGPTQGYLVATSDVTPWTELVGGIPVLTAPLLLDKNVDLMSITGAAPNLFPNMVLDITDALDPIINVGTLYYKLTVTTIVSGSPVATTVVLKEDISGQAGALLTQKPSGERIQAYQTTANPHLTISYADLVNGSEKLVSGNGTAMATKINTLLNLGNNTPFKLVSQSFISATADIEYGTMTVSANNTTLVSAFDGTNTSVSTDGLLATANVTTAVTILGYYPKARRTNSNLRSNGTIIDPNTTKRYIYPVNLQAPITSRNAVGSSNNFPLESLVVAANLRTNGRCVKQLEGLEKTLTSANGISSSSPVIAEALGIIPTYNYNYVDVQDKVSSLNSKDNLDNLRGQITSALAVMIKATLVGSGYLAALQAVIGDLNAYEVILVTDPQIAGLIFTDGDIRTFGDGVKFQITQSINDFFKGKIYFSFRLAGGSETINPLDFGRLLVTPPLTYEVQVMRNGTLTNEVQLIPRANAYITLPILGRLDIRNLEILYATSLNSVLPLA